MSSHRESADRVEAENSTFLSPIDASGRHADFHALRHTFITGLVAGGVNPKVAQTLARHFVITLTMDRYAHAYAGNIAAALDALPDLISLRTQTAKATGTDGGACSSPNLSPDSGVQHRPTQLRGVEEDCSAIIAHDMNRVDLGVMSTTLTAQRPSNTVAGNHWRGGRAVECAGFENRLG